jgi:apolipoprotein D and lipocalin family protein
MMRKGLTKGSGRIGYYNIIAKDPMVHRQSAMGIKQPQQVRGGFSEFIVNPFTLSFAAVVGIELTRAGLQRLNRWYMSHLAKKQAADPSLSLADAHRQTLAEIKSDPKFAERAVVDTDSVLGGKVTAIDRLDVKRYMGRWNEIASMPAWFQKGCKDAIAEYSVRKGHIQVKNSCLRDGKRDYAFAKAYPVNAGKSKLEVDFIGGRLLTGDYWVLHTDYKTAIVGTPDKKYLWILARSKTIPKKELNRLKMIAKSQGFDTSRLKGGKVTFSKKGLDVYDLTQENAIYVPSTDSKQRQIPASRFRKRIKETEDFLSELYGGFTRFDDYGGYYSPDTKRVIKEKGARVVGFATRKDIANPVKKRKLKDFLLRKRKEWGQETIGFENEGDLHYISPAKKMQAQTG